ncbi:MAG: hypothetical protein QFB86_02765, partial [Patescibacteria group bacterium]|nr:hypothetical protein [Patescibacteria group bacterium]
MITQLITQFAAPCPGGSFLGFPHWYKYLDGKVVNGLCGPQLHGLNDVWLIVAAIIEIMLKLSAIVAVGFVIYGGISYIVSQGESEKTARARGTIVNALLGLAIAIT